MKKWINSWINSWSVLLTTLLLTGFAWSAELPTSYTVQKGDTLNQISRKLGISVADLKKLNNLSSDAVKIGQVLLLSRQANQTLALEGVKIFYPNTVKMGDVFSLRIWGKGAEAVQIRFPSETAEDVRQPAEKLDGLEVGDGSFVVLGRVVLGAVSSEVRFTATLNGKTLEGRIPMLRPARERVDQLNVPSSVIAGVTEATQTRENGALEAAYALRTPRAWKTPFMAPIKSFVTNPFGGARRYEMGGKVNYHFGTDLKAAQGEAIYAANTGKVVIADFYQTRGGLVGIDHGAGVISLYFHQSKILVKVGDTVEKGQQIGEVGSTGYSTAAHLHWEMRIRGEGVDPWQWVGKLIP
jgi:murein DD-endopeptidase MepM/ murein hydrolase activator NlpD